MPGLFQFPTLNDNSGPDSDSGSDATSGAGPGADRLPTCVACWTSIQPDLLLAAFEDHYVCEMDALEVDHAVRRAGLSDEEAGEWPRHILALFEADTADVVSAVMTVADVVNALPVAGAFTTDDWWGELTTLELIMLYLFRYLMPEEDLNDTFDFYLLPEPRKKEEAQDLRRALCALAPAGRCAECRVVGSGVAVV